MNPTNGNMNRTNYSNGYSENYSRVNNCGTTPVRAVPKKDRYEENGYSGYGSGYSRNTDGYGNNGRNNDRSAAGEQYRQPEERNAGYGYADERIDPYAYSGSMRSPGCYQYAGNQYGRSGYRQKTSRPARKTSLKSGINNLNISSDNLRNIGLACSILCIASFFMNWIGMFGFGTSPFNLMSSDYVQTSVSAGPAIAAIGGLISAAAYSVPRFSNPNIKLIGGILSIAGFAIFMMTMSAGDSIMMMAINLDIGAFICILSGIAMTFLAIVDRL